ncbi:glycosyltransferase family 4 protein [Proteinivorax hydrogeniformans]|uniref:Glycosyltransferase family 4 protein n=1 Tax=Proteinivorax hydrogeniformans TaxID=1826727 RepID=A0AAU8HWS8_9FIRM
MRKIWIFNHYACTPKTGPLLRHYYFAKEMNKRNYEVRVFAANEVHYNNNSIDTMGGKYVEKNDEGQPFVFVKTTKYKGNGISRVRNMLSYFFNLFPATAGIAKDYGKPDVIIGSSVHPLACVAGIQIAKRFKIPCIIEIRDLWPEAVFSFGKVKENSILGKLLTAGEKWIYKHSDAIIFTKEGDIDHIKEMKWDTDQGGEIDLSKCFYINNGVDTETFNQNKETNQYNDTDLIDDSFKVIYTGSVRPVNNIDNIIDAAVFLKDNPDIKILIFGTGSDLDRLEQRIRDEGLSNVKIKGFVEKKYIPYILSKSSVNILNYSQHQYNWTRGNSSNKLFEYMASGKPIISTVKMGYCILEKYKCGYSLKDSTPQELANKILEIKNLPEQRYKFLCKNAKEGSTNFDYKALTDQLGYVVDTVMKRNNKERR